MQREGFLQESTKGLPNANKCIECSKFHEYQCLNLKLNNWIFIIYYANFPTILCDCLIYLLQCLIYTFLVLAIRTKTS